MLDTASSPSAKEVTRQEPPSSLEPPVARARVSHSAQRVTRCRPTSGKERAACDAHREPAVAAATVQLVPIAAANLAADDERSPVSVTFAADAAPQQRDVDLAPGEWEVRFGPPPQPRFRVAAHDEIAIAARTLLGSCVYDTKRGDCRLDPAPRARSAEVGPLVR